MPCYGGDGSQELIGSGGNDKIFGQRGNDVLKGFAGNDQLFGGVGDESEIAGNAGSDLLSGGLGTDVLDGGGEDDLIRGDGTIDKVQDSGGSGGDIISFATGVTPGFHGAVGITGFPADADNEERGVYARLDAAPGLCGADSEGQALEACNNDARYGGGSDHIIGTGLENAIGSPFADYIVGSTGVNRIDGGGGADVIYGNAGNDTIYGGPDGDFLDGQGDSDTIDGQRGVDNCVAETPSSCAGTAESVDQRERQYISVGFMETALPMNYTQLFMTGSTGIDKVKATYSTVNGTGFVTFTGETGSASFDTSTDAASTNCEYTATVAKCALPKPLDAITVAGTAGNDNLTLEGFPETTSPTVLGGEGDDVLTTNAGTEDMLVDGNGVGNDTLRAFNYDDALINNEGSDLLEGGRGNDLLLNAVNCDGDTLDGARASEGDEAAVNSASWAKYTDGGVVADLEKGKAGNFYGATAPSCSVGTPATLLRLDDLEGSSANDALYGDGADNNLLARLGTDELWGRAGNDRLEASGDNTIDRGGGGGGHTAGDGCVVDLNEKANFAGCETFPEP